MTGNAPCVIWRLTGQSRLPRIRTTPPYPTCRDQWVPAHERCSIEYSAGGEDNSAQRLDTLQEVLTENLKPLGFRRKARSYNRRLEVGLIQVIGVQMGSYDLAGQQAQLRGIKQFRADLYGQFTVNLGVFVPEVYESQGGRSPKSFVAEYDCAIRSRLGGLRPSRQDLWWHLDQPPDQVAANITQVLDANGFPFLERFSTRRAIIEQWVAFNEAEQCLSPRARIDVAVMLVAQGHLHDAAKLLEEDLQLTSRDSKRTYIRDLGRKLGLGELAERDSD